MIANDTAAPIGRAGAAVWAREHAWQLVIAAAALGWSLLLFAEVRADYNGFRVARFDLGNMVQAVWSTAHGRPLEMTLGSGEQTARLASHVDPILVLLAPLWVVFPSPLTVAAAQIAALALGAFPVFWLARRHLGSELAAGLLALAYLAYPWLSWTALDAMHPVTLAIPLLLYALWFLDSGRLWAFAVCAVLVAATGELMALSVAGLGLWYWLARGRRGPGLVIAVAGFAWTVACIKVVVPAFHGGESPFYGYYAEVGGSPEGVVKKLFTDPSTILSALFSTDELRYLIWLGAPLAGLFLLSPLALLALPQFVANALSQSPPTTDPRHQYIAAVVPFFIAGTVFGIARLRSARPLVPASIVLGLSLLLTMLVGAWGGAPGAGGLWYQDDVAPARVDALHDAVALVPADAPVSATNKVGSHLSARRYFYSVPVLERSEWIVLDMKDPMIAAAGSPVLGPHPKWLRQFRRDVEGDPGWAKVFERAGVLVFRRDRAR
jgi:uncharacterized membrane protein